MQSPPSKTSKSLPSRLALALSSAGMLPSRDDILRELHYRSFYEFFTYHWHEMEPGSPYIEARHTRAVCDHLQAVYEGTIPQLSIEIGPGYGKSLVSAVAFPAWIWGPRRDPGYRFGFSTYADDLTTRDSARCRDLLKSATYQRLYGHQFRLIKEREDYLRNDRGGYRVALAVKGKATGWRFNLWVGDDLLNMREAFSEPGKEAMKLHLRATSTRGQIGKPYYRVIIGQRLHEEDAGGYAREKNFTVLCLPTEYDPSRHCVTPIFEDWRTKRGELLFPAGFGPDRVAQAKFDLDNDYSAQHQQLPIPVEGGVIKGESIRLYDAADKPSFSHHFASVDTAQGQGSKNDKTAISMHGVFQDGIALVDGWTGRKPAPQIIELLKDFGNKYEPTCFVIEQRDWGKALTQLLEGDHEFRWRIEKYTPIVSKDMRAHEASPLFFRGRYWMPRGTPLSEQATAQLVVFPAAKNRDLADSIVQAAIYAQQNYTFGAVGYSYEGAGTAYDPHDDDDYDNDKW